MKDTSSQCQCLVTCSLNYLLNKAKSIISSSTQSWNYAKFILYRNKVVFDLDIISGVWKCGRAVDATWQTIWCVHNYVVGQHLFKTWRKNAIRGVELFVCVYVTNLPTFFLWNPFYLTLSCITEDKEARRHRVGTFSSSISSTSDSFIMLFVM